MGVATAQLERLPGRSLERIAILCENEFRHYPRKLRLVEVSGLVRAAGNYRCRDETIRLRVKFDAERYIHVFAHEFAHAILARCDASTLAGMKRVVTAVRRENLQALGEFFWSIRHADYLRAFFLCNDFVENGKKARYLHRRVTHYPGEPDFRPKPVTIRVADRIAFNFRYHKGMFDHEVLRRLPSVLVSGYSLSKPAEYFCEHFAAYHCGSDNPFARQIGEWAAGTLRG